MKEREERKDVTWQSAGSLCASSVSVNTFDNRQKLNMWGGIATTQVGFLAVWGASCFQELLSNIAIVQIELASSQSVHPYDDRLLGLVYFMIHSLRFRVATCPFISSPPLLSSSTLASTSPLSE